MTASVGRRVLLYASSPIYGHALSRMAEGAGLQVTRVRDDAGLGTQPGPWDLCLSQDAPPRDVPALRSVPVIVFSSDPARERPVLAQGASGFLRVPCREREFEELIGRWMDMRTAGARAPAPVPATRATAPSPPPPEKGPEGPLVLLVDDSQVIHGFVDAALSSNGYRVAHAEDGAQGLAAARALAPALVISDIDMPVMDGFEMCRQIKAAPETRHIPILVLSARGAGVDIDRGFDVGANDFLTKPVSENELVSRVQHVLGAGDARRTRETVLVVEDSAVQRGVIVQALVQQGFRVAEAEHGRAGLEQAVALAPDLVITDSEMPEMNGRDLTREIKRIESLSDVPVMMLTAADSELSRAKGRHAGVAAYLTKPFVPDKVVVIAEKLIAERRLLRERQALRHYTSDTAAEAAAAAADAKGDVDAIMRAEVRRATILFSDIVGFTPLTERLEPAVLVGLLNAYFDAMAPLFREHGGVIDKFIGDAIMGVFLTGGGEDDREGACRAVATGLAMIERLEAFNRGRAEPLRVRVGINTGDVIMGDIGSRLYRRDYTTIGDNVNVAARLESNATPMTVLVSEATWRRVEDRYEGRARGPIAVKGKSVPISVHEIVGPRAAGSAS